MRLIDSDALYRSFEEVYREPDYSLKDAAWWFFGKLGDAPTITPPPNDPLTLEELREMDDADVWVSYPQSADGEQLIMHALVEVVKENGVVWLTNNLGGRSTFDEVSEYGGLSYRRRPEEVK